MTTYQAILIHPEVNGHRCSGTLQIKADGVFFTSDELNYTIKFKDLQINAGGAGNRFVFLKDKLQEEISIYTSEKAILKDHYIVSNPNLSEDLRQSKNTLNKKWVVGILSLLLIFFLIGGLFLVKDKMVKSIAKQVPISWEQKAGDKLFSTLSMQYHFIKNDSLKKEFLKVASPLFRQVETQGYKIDLYFVKDETINAFALPGGKVIVQSGLIANAKSWEEVMGVLSHELAHVTERHHVRGVINDLGFFTLLSVVLGDVSALAGTIIDVGGNLASLSNSRAFENEADEQGWEYLVNAKINPNGLVSFFETLKKEHETEIDTILSNTIDLSYLSTHPNTQDRINHLKEKAKKFDQNSIPLPSNFNDFKTALLQSK